MSIIKVDCITVDYVKGKGVFDLSFEVNKGEVVGFLGPNGAGKTTTIRQLMGFARPDRGQCLIMGLDCKDKASVIQENVGYLPGEITFMDDMTGTQFICFMAKMKRLKDMRRVDRLTELLELDMSGKIKKMSKGMKQKVGIVCAFMSEPGIIILDEPTSGLDPLMQTKFVELINEEKKKGTTILMSSHMFEEIERTCDRAVIIKEGRLMAVEDIVHLKEKKRKEYRITLADEQQARKFAERFAQTAVVSGMNVNVVVTGDLMRLISAMAEFKVTGLESVSQNLEDIFMNYYGTHEVQRGGIG